MKRPFTLFVFLLLAQGLRAQHIIFNEKFDEFTTYAITGWSHDFSGVVPWQTGLPFQVAGCMPPVGGPMTRDAGTDKVAAIADCGMIDYNNSNVLLYTSSINLSTVSGAWLKYDSYFEKNTYGVSTENATVEVSVNDGATWTVIQAVPANPSLSSFKTWYIDLSAYSYFSGVRIGFRYSDDGGHMTGWAIDNVQVIVPARKDLALLSVTPDVPLLGYVPIGTGFMHHAQVYNTGLDTIHAFRLKYRLGTGPVKTDAISGVSLPPFSITDVTHSIPDTVFFQGAFPVTMWVDLDSDAYHYNDTARTSIAGADFIPSKKLVIESGEGTWNGWSPRSMVYLNSVAGTGTSASLISVHHYDPMADSLYADFLSNLFQDYVPYMLFDRRSWVPIDNFYTYLNEQKNYFGFADLSLTGHFNDNILTVNGTVTAAVDMTGDYRLAVVVTEDGVQGSGADYDAANNYAGGSLGPMGGYESLSDPVPASDMIYDHVARMISPGTCGNYGLLPYSIASSTPFDFTLSLTTDASWRPEKMKAIVLLINNADSTILNSNEIPFPLKTANLAPILPQAGLYPNPSWDYARVYFTATHSEAVTIYVTDMSGRKLYEHPITTFAAGKNEVAIPVQQLQTGIYLVSIQFGEGKKTLKMEVIH